MRDALLPKLSLLIACFFSCSDHYNRVVKLHKDNGVSITKATHAGRSFTCKTAREHNTPVYDTKAHGLWSMDIMHHCYNQHIPVKAVLGTAMFDSKKPEKYFLPRGELSESLSAV